MSQPVLGASGIVSAVMVLYALQFPKARISIMLFRTLHTLPIWLWLGAWITLQILGALSQISGFGRTSYLGHLGGAAVGFSFWLLKGRGLSLSRIMRFYI